MGRYRKFAMDDEFCDESYYANQSHTLPAMSMRKLADSEFVGSAEVHRDEVGESLGPSSIRHRPRTSTSSSVEETNRVRPGYDTEEPTEYEDGQLLSVDTYAPPALPRSREDLEYVSDKRGKDEGQVIVEDTSCKPLTLSGASNDKAMRIGDSHHERALLVEDERSNTASLVADINQGQQLRDRSPSVIVSEDTSVKRFTRSDSPERCAGEHADEFEARKENAGSTPKERRKSFQIFGETSDSDENENAYQPLAQPSLRKVKPLEDLSKEADGPATNCEHTMDTYQEPQPVIDYHRRSDQSHVAEISPHSAEGTSVSVIHTAHEANANSDAIHKFALETVDQLDIADVYQSQLLAPRRVHARHIAPSEVKAFKPDVRQAVEAVVYERDVDRTPPSATHSDRNEQHEGSEYQRPPLSAAMVDVQPPLVEEVRKIEPVYHRPLSRLSVNKSDHSKPTTIEQCLARSDGQSSSQARDFVSTSPPSTGDTYEAPLTPTAESHPAAHGVKKYVGHIAHHKESVSERRSSEAAVEDTYVRPLVSPSAKHTQANVNGSSRMERIRPVEPSSTNETYKPPPATAPSARYTNDDVMQEVTGFIEQPVQRATVSVASTTVDNYKERPTPAPRRHSTKNDATGGGSMSNVGHVLPAGTSTVEIIDNRPDETTTEVHRITSIRAHVKEGAVVPKAPADTSAPLIVDTFQKPPIYRKPVLNNTTGVNVKAKEFHMEPNRPIDGTPLSSAGDRYEKPPSPVPHSSVTSGHIHDHYIEFAPAKTISVRSSTSSAENTDKGPSTPILGSSTNRDDNRDFSISRIEHSQSATSKSSTYETFEDVYERPSTPSSDTPPIHRSSSSDAEETNRSNIPKHQAKAHQAPYHRQEQGSRARDTYIRPRTPSTGDTESSGAQSVGSDGDEKRIPRKESKAKTEVSPVERRCRQLEKNKSASGDRERRTRSLIEPAVSESVMPPRRRANTSDLILSKELEAFVNQHHCDPICCSLVCPKRLARSPYVMHDADRLNSYTNLDILKRRRLSYLLAIEAQSFLRDHGSKYISAACDMLADDGYKSPDSGCEPSSKISDGSDAMLADDDSSSVDEEQVNHELAKIEHRRLSVQPELVWKPLLIPAPTEFREAVATQMDDTYREPEPPIYENIHEGTIKVSQAKNGEPRQITTTQTFVDAAEPRKPNMPPMPRTAFSAAASSENAHRQQHDQDKSGATTAVPSRLTDVVHQSPPEPSRNKSRVTEFAAQQMLGDARTAPSVDRETIKAQFEGQIVCEALPRNPKQNAAGEKRPALATPQSEVSESTARFALDSWRSIWKGVPSEEVPQLSDDEIISLHDSILSILADRVTLKGVRAALRDAIRKVLQKTQLVTSQQKFDVTWRRQDISWQSQNTRYEKPETEQRAVDGTQRRPPAQEQANEELVTQRF